MSLLKKSDEEIIKIAGPIWANLLKTSPHKCFMELMKLNLVNNGQTTS